MVVKPLLKPNSSFTNLVILLQVFFMKIVSESLSNFFTNYIIIKERRYSLTLVVETNLILSISGFLTGAYRTAQIIWG